MHSKHYEFSLAGTAVFCFGIFFYVAFCGGCVFGEGGIRVAGAAFIVV